MKRIRCLSVKDLDPDTHPHNFHIPLAGALLLPIGHGFNALVDEADYDNALNYRWRLQNTSKTVYVFRSGNHGLHHLIFGSHQRIDHKNGNGLDNRRQNLRPCTSAQNQINSGLRPQNKSGFKGVHKSGARWRSMLVVGGRIIHLGRFNEVEDAARAYDKEALKHFGEFARLNFPTEANPISARRS